jgi:hypothetical protein
VWVVGWPSDASSAIAALTEALGEARIVNVAALIEEVGASDEPVGKVAQLLAKQIDMASGREHVVLDATPLGDDGQRRFFVPRTLMSVPSTMVIVLGAPEGTPLSSSKAGAVVSTYAMAESIPTCFLRHGSPQAVADWLRNRLEDNGDDELLRTGWPA